ncbi:MAG: glycosyltransferase [Ardenticatenaceae bacterium]|nr:glycosyltransferase [Ardenticatenaceae bacterium]
MNKVPCTVGIFAHNEEANIGKLLTNMCEQRLQTVEIREIIVVSSGSFDETDSIVREYAAQDPRIKLLVQERREGKASAINLFLRQMTERVLVICSADLQPELDTIEKLIAPFADPEMGMTSSRPVPVNVPDTFMGFAAHLLWGLHHEINASGGFKAGEMIAFIKIFERIPYKTSVDEASIEPVIRGQGYKVQYIADAVVLNKGPETVADFLRQRRRIYSGHLDIKHLLGYSVSTMSGGHVLKMLLKRLDWRPKQFVWTWGVVLLEVYGRYLGWRDFKNRKDHTVWEIAKTTKELSPTKE